MRIQLSSGTIHSDFVERITEIAKQDLLACNQCGKCSAGCPMCSAMDILPNQIIRFAQLGLEQDIMNSRTVWICASCLTCTARCPRGVDLGRVMEAIRLISLRKNKDFLAITTLPKDVLGELPQIALVSAMRKHTA